MKRRHTVVIAVTHTYVYDVELESTDDEFAADDERRDAERVARTRHANARTRGHHAGKSVGVHWLASQRIREGEE